MKRATLALGLAVLLFFSCSTTGTGTDKQGDLLPFDTAVRYGRLENGLRYYIRANKKPENRIEMRLVVNAGSILEDENQLGIAHFLEHLAFNGTLHYKKDRLIDALESMGMRFGQHLNAATGFDETFYRLQVPTDKPEYLDTAFLILEDWAHNISLEPEEVEKERGVIIEEWRAYLGADERIMDEHIKALFKNSRYAVRKPIGDLEIVKTVTSETIRRFYEDWYRPDLMAVIVIGDVDPARIEQKIRERFSGIKPGPDPKPRPFFEVPANIAPLVSIVNDKEATESAVTLLFKHLPTPLLKLQDYRALLAKFLFLNMLQARLGEIVQRPDAPFISASTDDERVVRSLSGVSLSAVAKEGKIAASLETLLTEVERVKRFGFTESELARQKLNLLSAIEQTYKEKDKRQSGSYAEEYTRHFLIDEASPGIEYELELYRRFLPGFTTAELNKLAGQLFMEENRVLLVSAPDKPGAVAPSEKELIGLFESVKKKPLEAYKDDTSDLPLVGAVPQKGTVVTASAVEEVGIVEWRLSNGVRVLFKPTDFKNDEIVMQAWSPGGSSLVSDKEYIAALTACDLVSNSGLGFFSRTDLAKKLAGKQVRLSPWIQELQEGFSGTTRNEDFETLLQLVYLYFTASKIEPEIFAAYRDAVATQLSSRTAAPENVFSDTLQTVLSNGHFRSRPLTPEIIAEFDMEASLRIFRERFADAGDFTFIFSGSVDPEKLKPLIETWLGGLPAGGVKESWKNVGVTRPAGVVTREVRKGTEPKSMTAIVFHGPFAWDIKEVVTIHALAEITRLRLTDAIREEEGGTYGVQVGESPVRFPAQEYLFSIACGTDPARADELTRRIFEETDRLGREPMTDEELNKVKEAITKEREQNMKTNSFWASVIMSYTIYGESPARVLEYMKYVRELDREKIRSAAAIYLDQRQYVRVVLLPEK